MKGALCALRVPLEAYAGSARPKVYSLVAVFPFSPIDIDVGRMARGVWNPLSDRFRIWYLPKVEGEGREPLCYVMIRKLDPRDMVIVYAHVVFNLGLEKRSDERTFTVGILCNDDVRARAALNSMLEVPPSFHRRGDVQLVERRWRDDPDAVMRFIANVHSAMAHPGRRRNSKALRVDLPPAIFAKLTQNIGAWWK